MTRSRDLANLADGDFAGTWTVDGLTVDGDATFTGASYSVVWDKSDNALEFGDNAKAVFGAGSDLQIYHDGSASFISDQGTGDIKILADDFYVQNAAGNSTLISVLDTGKVGLGFAGSEKLATTSSGIDVTGGIVADHHVNIGVGMSYQWGDSHERIEQSDGKIEFFTNNGQQMTLSGSSLGIGTDSPTAAYSVHVKSSATTTANFDAGSDGYDVQLRMEQNGSFVGAVGYDDSEDAVYLNKHGNATQGLTVVSGGNVSISHSSGDTLTLTKSTTEPSLRFEGDSNKDFVLTISGETFTLTTNDGATDILVADHDTRNVGIGITPAAPLHLKHGPSGSTTEAFRIADDAGNTTVQMLSGAADGEIKIAAAGVLRGSYKAQFAGTSTGHSFNLGTSGANAITIDTSQNVGISESNPISPLHINLGTNQNLRVFSASSAPTIGSLNDANSAYAALGYTGSQHEFRIGTSDAMRIDSSGNVFINKTAENASVTGFQFKPSGEAIIGRAGDDTHLIFQNTSAGSTIGSIGTNSTRILIKSNGDASGLRFDAAGYTPFKNSAVANGTVDLGYDSGRFKDLYLSNRVKLSAGGGIEFGNSTGGRSASSTLFDDYEEGTWTPIIIGSSSAGSGTYGSQNGTYTKIGRIVTFQFYLTWTNHTGSGNIEIGGFPFNAASQTYYLVQTEAISLLSNSLAPVSRIEASSDKGLLIQSTTGGSSRFAVAMDTAGEINGQGTYQI